MGFGAPAVEEPCFSENKRPVAGCGDPATMRPRLTDELMCANVRNHWSEIAPNHHVSLAVAATDCSQGRIVPKALGVAMDAMPATDRSTQIAKAIKFRGGDASR
jgi:hypothetical protein